MKTKTWIIILGICAIIFGGLGYHSISKKTATQPVTLKTYTNTLIGFTFQYPSDHTPFHGIGEQNNKPFLIPASADADTVEIANNENQVFCCEPATLTFGMAYDPGDMKGARDTVFNGRPAKEIDGSGSLGNPYKIIRVTVGEFYLTIVENQQDAMLDQILSSVAFTK